MAAFERAIGISDGAYFQHILGKYMQYRQAFEKKPNFMPKRIIFYRGWFLALAYA